MVSLLLAVKEEEDRQVQAEKVVSFFNKKVFAVKKP